MAPKLLPLGILFLALALALAACDASDGGGVPGDDTAAPADSVTPAEDTPAPGPDTALTGPDTLPGDLEPPVVALVLTQYAALSGEVTLDATWSDDTGVVAVEVLVDGEVVGTLDAGRASFDSTVCPHGVHALSLRAVDAAGNATETEPVLAVFAGPGQFLAYQDGWQEGQIPGWGGLQVEVPAGATTLYDQKAHVTVPEGTGEVLSWLQWRTTSSWYFGYDIGTGNCPDSGMKLDGDEQQAEQWLLEVSYQDPDGAPPGTWFAHVRFLDAGDHAGTGVHLNSLFLAVPKH